ncbi:hypothetical protein AZSI13_07230 [Azospira sp. I13]|nr:hypothetical protein AZSI13_07230 [Azospira sp. I13]
MTAPRQAATVAYGSLFPGPRGILSGLLSPRARVWGKGATEGGDKGSRVSINYGLTSLWVLRLWNMPKQ